MPAHTPALPDLRAHLLRAQSGAQVDFLDHVSHHAVDTARQLSKLNPT